MRSDPKQQDKRESEKGKTRKLILTSRKIELKPLRHIMKTEGMANLTVTGYIKCKRSDRKGE